MRLIKFSFIRISITISLAIAIASCGGGNSSTSSSTPIYTMIFDAGSSGTRVNFYKVVPGNGGYPQITLLDNQSFDDNGINDFLSGNGTIDPRVWTASSNTGLPQGYTATGCTMTLTTINGGSSDVGPCVLQPLLDAMAGAMAAAGVSASQVKVELFATAGMRTMSIFNGGSYTDAQIASFYETMRNYVSATKGFMVGDFQTTNGNSQEGLWTWVNLNDQYYNAFGGNTTYYSGTPTTRGNFEVGGSSMQIAFPSTSILPSDANNVYSVRINGYSYNVFSKTYLGLGGDDARKFVRSYGYSNASTSGYTGIDCFGSNANPTNTVEDSGIALFNATFFPQVTTPGSGNQTGITWATNLLNNQSPLVLSANGAFNLNTCSNKYNDVTTSVMTLPRNNFGTLSDGSQASYSDLVLKVALSTSAFVGLDGFYFTAQALGLVPSGQIKSNFTRSDFTTALQTTCPDSGAGPTAGDGSASNKMRRLSACPNAVYMNNFLWKYSNSGGLFSSATGATFEGVVPSSIGTTSVLSWTRGYLLLKYAN